jgi:hypothetical protein
MTAMSRDHKEEAVFPLRLLGGSWAQLWEVINHFVAKEAKI